MYPQFIGLEDSQKIKKITHALKVFFLGYRRPDCEKEDGERVYSSLFHSR
jgi:hypothetical protein